MGTLPGVKFVMIFAKESKKWDKSSERYILHAIEKFFVCFVFIDRMYYTDILRKYFPRFVSHPKQVATVSFA